MKCYDCGQENLPDAKFCSKCGNAFYQQTPASQDRKQQVVNSGMQAKGLNGSLLLFQDSVRIERKGIRAFMLMGAKGDKDIQISSISAIQFKKAGSFLNGYIQFSFFGGAETKAGIMDATRDENTVMFTSNQQPEFEAIKFEIERRKNAPSHRTSSGVDDLEKLAGLRDKGIITQAEFEAKKKQILGL